MKDTRPESCKHAEYEKYDDTVSIILDFHEHQFYNLKMTLESIVKFTPDHLYHEIVLLDDGSGESFRDLFRVFIFPREHWLQSCPSENKPAKANDSFKKNMSRC